MVKIGFGSRYYEQFNVFQTLARSGRLFKLIGERQFPEHMHRDYKCEINPVTAAATIISNIKKFLEDNLYTNDEKKLFIENLIPYIDSFGTSDCNNFKRKFDQENFKIQSLDKETEEWLEELRKAYNALIKVREILQLKIATYYIEVEKQNNNNVKSIGIVDETDMEEKALLVLNNDPLFKKEQPLEMRIAYIQNNGDKVYKAMQFLQKTLTASTFENKLKLIGPFYELLKAIVELYDAINNALKSNKKYHFDSHVIEIKKHVITGLTEVINSMPRKKEITDLIAKKLFEIKNEELIREIEGSLPTAWQKILKKYLLNQIEYNRLTMEVDKVVKPTDQVLTIDVNQVPQSFDELFKDTRYIEPCYGILMECDKPLISEEFEYIGSVKGAFCVWIEAMESIGGIIKKSKPEVYTELLGKKIKNFSIHKTMFEKSQSRAEKKYKDTFNNALDKIKLSLLSENRK